MFFFCIVSLCPPGCNENYRYRYHSQTKNSSKQFYFKILILAFINTRLDYCNSLYFGIADGLKSRLESVQNAAARFITGVRQCEHIIPALRQLHWLPVRRRVDFKISTFVYRSLAGTAPVYLADECTLVTAAGRRPLRVC